jgi:hypothetical protein
MIVRLFFVVLVLNSVHSNAINRNRDKAIYPDLVHFDLTDQVYLIKTKVFAR